MRRNSLASLASSLALGCSGSSGLADVAAQSLMGQMGGMDSMSNLAGSILESSLGDIRLSSLADSNVEQMTPELSNQLCSMLGGGCAAPLSEEEIAQGAEKLTPAQADAVKQNLGTSLGGMNLSSTLQGAVSKALAPKLPGIIGALL